jgi:hydroxyquinol 1,2-dioxygenase
MNHPPVQADELLAEVVRRYDASPNPRLREVTTSAIRHLHAFALDVGLTRDEWMAGIQFLTATGKICDDVRQEFILLSDTLGLSMLVEFITYAAGNPAATENTVLGPFYVPGSPVRGFGESMLVDGDLGEKVVIRGRVLGVDGAPIAGAALDCWQNASNGFYACQQPELQSSENLRGIYHSRDDGSFEMRTIRPSDYPIPGDGPVGKLLMDNGRDIMRPAHVHIMASAPGCKTLITHVFDRSSKHLEDDAVFGVRGSLVRDFEPDDSGELEAVIDLVLVGN